MHKSPCKADGKFNISCSSEYELSKASVHILHKRYFLLATYHRYLKQFNLSSQFEPEEIFSEAYTRIRKKIRKGEIIINLLALYKCVGYNLVREKHRYVKRQRKLQRKLQSFNECIHEDACQSDREFSQKRIDSILKPLSKIDKKIVILRLLNNMTWKNVCETLIEDGDLKCDLSQQCINQVKKRFSRAIKRIKVNLQ